MLELWTAKASKGNPQFSEDGQVRSIICGPDDRGLWTAEALVQEYEELYLLGSWTNGRVRIVFLDVQSVELSSVIFDEAPEDNLIAVPAETYLIRVNCIRNANGTAVFDDVDLSSEKEPEQLPDSGLPIPEPYDTPQFNVTGYKSGNIVYLWIQDEEGVGVPPNYGDEEENVIPYEVRGIQRGRVLTLEIGNMVVTEEESVKEI